MEKIILTEDNLMEAIQKTSVVLSEGGVVVFPTDTLYALGVNVLSERGVDKLFSLKKRPADKPVPVFVGDIEMAHELAFVDNRQEEVLKKLWPGPFTFVLQKKDTVNSRLSAETEKIGLRVPRNEFCNLLLKELSSPVTGSSANVSGMEPGRETVKIIEQFKSYSELPDLIIDTGLLPPAEPSAVIDISENELKIIRQSSALDNDAI